MGTGGSFLPLSPLSLYQNTSFPCVCSRLLRNARRETCNSRYNVFKYIKRKSAPLPYLLFSPSISGALRISFVFSIFFPEDWQLHSKFYFRTFGFLPFPFKAPFKFCFSHSFLRSVKIIDFLFRNRFRFVSYRLKDFFSILLRSSPRPISIGQLHALLRFHLRPINLVVCKGSYYLSIWDILSWGEFHA